MDELNIILQNGNQDTLYPKTTIERVIDLATTLATCVTKVDGKGLSTNDLTNTLLAKLNGLENYNDSALSASISSLQTQLNTLVNGSASTAIDTFSEIVSFLGTITDTTTLAGIIAGINTAILAEKNRAIAAENAIKDNVNDLCNEINVDKLYSLDSGYYTLSTATAAVPVGNLRKAGAMITFQSASGVIENYQYTNSDVANWNTLANWELVSISGKYGNLGIITNFDTIAKTGNYTAYGTSTGAPDANYSWFIEHINSSAGTVTAYQRTVAYSATLIIFERTKINSVWGDWIPVLKNEQTRSQNTNTSPSSKLFDDEFASVRSDLSETQDVSRDIISLISLFKIGAVFFHEDGTYELDWVDAITQLHTKRIVTNKSVFITKGTVISAVDGYRFYLIRITDGVGVSLGWNTSYVFDVSAQYILQVARSLSEVVISSIDDLAGKIKIKLPDMFGFITISDVAQWQVVDDEPTAGSNNLVKSGGVANMRGASITEADISSFNRNVIIGGSGTNNRIVYWIQPAFIGAGELYVYSANKRVVISAGTDKNGDYDGNEVATSWTSVTPSYPALIRFSNSNYVCIKAEITEDQEADFLASLKFRISWYAIKDIKNDSINKSKIYDYMLKTANGATYFNIGIIPTISYPSNDSIKIKFRGNDDSQGYLKTIFTLFNGVYAKIYDAPSLEFTLNNAEALFFDNSKPIYSNEAYTETERIFVAGRNTVGDNYIMLLSNTNGVACGLLSVYAPIKIPNGYIDDVKIANIDASKIFDNDKIVEIKTSGYDFIKSDIIYGSIQEGDGNIAISNDRITTPSVPTFPGMTILLPTSITRNNIDYVVKVRVVGFNKDGVSIKAIGGTNGWVTIGSILIPNNCYKVRISYGLYNNNTAVVKPALLDNYVDNEFYVHYDREYSFLYDVANINKNVNELVANNIVTQNKQRKIDAYSMIRKFGEVSISNTNKNFTCLFFSDVHADSVAVDRLISLTNDWGNLYFDCVINGGDSVAQNILEGLLWYNNIIETSEIPVLTTIGNHDSWTSQDPQTMADPEITYNAIFPTLIRQGGIIQPTGASDNYLMYYYKDFTNRGIRLIVLDCMHWDDAQSTWMQNLLSDAIINSLSVICVTHAPFNSNLTTLEDVTFSSFLGKGGDGLYSNIAMAENIKAFIDNGGEFITWLMGHTHRDAFTVFTDVNTYGNQHCVVISSARGTDSGQIFYPDSARNQDNYTRDHLDMLSVDKELGIFKIMRIGVNTDLQMRPKNFLTYDYVNHRIVSNS